MGSCMSCKAGKEAYAYTTSTPVHSYHEYHSMEYGQSFTTRQNDSKELMKRNAPYSRGQATLFGFKRRPNTAPSASTTPILDSSANAASATIHATPLSNRSSNSASQEELNNISSVSSGKSTPRLARPKKDIDGNNTVRTNRFGFRTSTPLAITNKVGDSNCNIIPPTHVISHHNVENQNVTSSDKPRAKGGGKLPQPKTTGIPVPGSTPDAPRNKVKSFIPKPEPSHEPVQATRFTLQTTHLPKLQYPVRLSSVDAEVKNTSKTAKTAANNSTRRGGVQGSGEESSSKEGSVNDDSGIGSHQSTAMSNGETDTLHGVEILDSSPTFGYRRNRNAVKPRALEMVLNGQSFCLRDLKDDDSTDPNVITEISVINLPTNSPVQNTGVAQGIVQERSRQYQRQIAQNNPSSNIQQHSSMHFSGKFRDEESHFREEGEEKVFRDSSRNEKSSLEKGLATPGCMEGEDWGHGEAMAEEFSSSSDDGHNHCTFSASSSPKTNIPVTAPSIAPNPRPVILMIEDPRFAAFAAAATTNMIEDEKSPVDSLISSPPSSSADDISEEQKQRSLLQDDTQKQSDCTAGGEGAMQRSCNTLSPDSPGTPTNASNSLSLSEGRDFLIDDEIADQPGLTFDDGTGAVGGDLVTSSAGCSSLILSVTENTTLVDTPQKPAIRNTAALIEGSPSPTRGRQINRTGSVDTLSPCESIASDDLMLDYERSERSELDCTADSRLDGSLPGGLHTLDESLPEANSDDHSEDPVKEWSVTASSLVKEAGLVTGRSRLLRSRTSSTPDSPRSIDSKPRAVSSPLRPARQSSVPDCDDGGLYLDRHTYHSICQDIVNHKTMLLKLMRHLQKAETLNPFDSSLKNGLFYNLASTDGPEGSTGEDTEHNLSLQEEVADLRRQVVFLQQQLEEKERTVQLLQIQMTKCSNAEAAARSSPQKETCNAATQTERIRPVSAGPSLLQSLPSESNGGPLVSLTDTWSRRKQPAAGDLNSVKNASRLPSVRHWKRNSVPLSDRGPRLEQTHIPSQRQSSLPFNNSVLSQKMTSVDTVVTRHQPSNSSAEHSVHLRPK